MKNAIRRIVMAAGFLGLTLGMTGRAGADMIVSNLANSSFGTDGPAQTDAGDEFTTGPNAELLQSVTLKLLNSGGPLTHVSILSDASNYPGAVLNDLGTITPSGTGISNYTLMPSTPLTLTANTNYWVVATYNGARSWESTDSPASTGSGTLDNLAYSSNNRAFWNVKGLGQGPYQVEVDGTAVAVPEPSSFVLLGTAVMMGLGCAWRLHRRVAA